MNFTKKAVSLIVVCALICTFFAMAGCHQKGETVVSVKLDDKTYDISSGVYLALQFESFNQFANAVNSDLSSAGTTISDPNDYLTGDYTVSGKNSSDWIDGKTLDSVKQYAAVLHQYEKVGLEWTSDDVSSVNQYVSYYWDQYKETYEKNGIGKDSYKAVIEYTLKKSKLFSFYYDAKSENKSTNGTTSDKIVSEEEIANGINNDFILSESFSISLTSTKTDENGNTVEYTDDEKAAFKTKLENYANRVNSGTAFATVKSEYEAESGTASEQAQDANASTDATADSDTPASIYPSTAKILSVDDQDKTEYDRMKKFKDAQGENFQYGKAFVVTTESDAYYLVVLYDLSKDQHYITEKRTSILSSLKEDEFNQFLLDSIPENAVTVYDSLVKYYNPKNISFATQSK